MMTFVLVAALMVTVALAWVLVPLLTRGHREGVALGASNAAILRDQQRELDADLAADVITREQYEESQRELERRVLDDAKVSVATRAAPTQAAAWTAAILGSAIPIAALVLYVTLGNHDAFAPAATRTADSAAQHEVTPEQVEAMAAKLAAKLEREPNNPEGWVMLARTYYALNRHADAAKAFERAITLVPDNADLLADYADSIGAAQGGLNGKPLELIDRALKADPTHWKALALAGTAAFDRKDFAQAIAYWERMKATVPPSSPLSGSIDASIAEARELSGLKSALAPGPGAAPAGASAKAPPTAAPAPSVAATSSAASAASAASDATVAGTVELAPSVAARAKPTDTVFIFARAVEGPKMPLAILRKQVKDLPVQFALDDSLAMTPTMALSKFPTVVVGARVSKSGNATPQPGDLEGFSAAVKTGTTGVVVIIDRALP